MQRGAEDVLSRETIPRAMRWVMVAGTGRQFGLQEKECWCADAIGYRLGYDGFGLVVGGWPGVDHIVAASFARGLEERAPWSLVQSRRRSLARPEYKRASCFAGAGNCTALKRSQEFLRR